MARPWTVEGAVLAARLVDGDERSLGRGDVQVDDAKLSRSQVMLSCAGGRLTVRRLGKNPSVVRHASGREEVLELNANVALNEGDELFLLPETHRFLVHAPKRSVSNTTESTAPAAKRARSSVLDDLAAVVPGAPPEMLESALEMCAGRADMAAELLLAQQAALKSPFSSSSTPRAPLRPSSVHGAAAKIPPAAAAASSSVGRTAMAADSGRRLFRLHAIKGREEQGTVLLSELIEGKGLEAALITTFMADIAWLLDAAPALTSVPVLLVHGQQPAPEIPSLVRNVTMHRPRMPMQYGVCHGKCFVLFYPTRLRFIVSTANLLDCDYERKTQGLWFEDFPRRAPNEPPSVFEDTLVDYIRRTGVPPAWLARIRYFSFASAQAVLLSSVPGRHESDNLHKYGHMQIRQLLSSSPERNMIANSTAPLICQASSMGSLNEPWLTNDLLPSFCASSAPIPRVRIPEAIRIVWPTVQFVRFCIDGYLAGASICQRSKNIKPFMRPLLYRYEPPQAQRTTIPPHIKSYYRPDAQSESPFVVLTSANLSMAAWGRLQLNGKQLAINNFELGVLFLPSRLALPGQPPPRLVLAPEAAESPDRISFPVPTRVPPTRYGASDVPWVQDEPHLQPDSHGFIDTGEPLSGGG